MTIMRPNAMADETADSSRDPAARYVYAIVPAGTAVPDDLRGVDDAPVELVRHGDIAAVVGTLVTDRTFGRREDLLAHSRVIDTLAEGPVVPVRFGSVLADSEQVVTELLEPNAGFFAEVIDELSGHRQFVIRARYDEEAVLAEVVSENDEIARLRDHTRELAVETSWNERVRLGELVARALEVKRGVDSSALLDLLTPHAVGWDIRADGGADHLMDVAFLVADDERDAFEAAAEQAARSLGGRGRVRLVGPTAPYDFVPGDESWAS